MSLLAAYVTFGLPLILVALGGATVMLQRASRRKRTEQRSQVQVGWRTP